MGFKPTSSDPCVYVSVKGEMFFIAIYVDDIILATKNAERLQEVKKILGTHFEVKDMGDLSYFLGMKVIQKENGSVWIGQPLYTDEVLKKIQHGPS